MSNYGYKYRSDNGQTLRGIFFDNTTLEEAMEECQEVADRYGVRVTLYETRFVETTLQQFDPVEDGNGE